MRIVKKIFGLIVMILAPVILFCLIYLSYEFISKGGSKDIHKPVPWIVIIGLFTPITVGFGIFGYYSFKGEYDTLPENHSEK
ncbi:MAG: hypothetical protein FGM46_06240 [Ferruginibacter sp.]|nr:hypothetical protein [Ferruginibacter sp.]